MIPYEMMADWKEYAVYADDEDGALIGISEDAPESAKKSYEEFKKLTEEAKREHIDL